MGWEVVVAVGALFLSALAVVIRTFDKSLSIREHDEFKKGVERALDGVQREVWREMDKLEHRVQVLEQTRPTTGELSGLTTGIKEQLEEVKVRTRPNS